MNYRQYLSSDDWKEKRNKRVTIDAKCSLCGKPFDLQVHHLTYRNIPNEKMTDLITLCGNCHKKIEDRKPYPGADSFIILNRIILENFCRDYKDKDYSALGDLNLCNLDTIKHFYYPYLKIHSGDLNNLNGVSIIQDYFRNRRYEVILRYMENGAEASIVIQQTKIKPQMVYKVFKNPKQAKRLLEMEEKL